MCSVVHRWLFFFLLLLIIHAENHLFEYQTIHVCGILMNIYSEKKRDVTWELENILCLPVDAMGSQWNTRKSFLD